MRSTLFSSIQGIPAFIPALLLLLFLLPPAQALAAGPMTALQLMQRGVDDADSDLFSQGIDIDSVVNKSSDSLLAALREQAASGNLPEGNITMLLGVADMAQNSGQGAFLKQMLVSEVRSFLVSGVNGGYFAGKPNGRVKHSGMTLASTLEKMAVGRREILPGKVISNENGKAKVSATFVDPEAGRFPLSLAVEERNGQWKVVEILNAAEVFSQVSRHGK